MLLFTLISVLVSVQCSTVAQYNWYEDDRNNGGGNNNGAATIYRALETIPAPGRSKGATATSRSEITKSAPSSVTFPGNQGDVIAEIMAAAYGGDGLSLEVINALGSDNRTPATDAAYGDLMDVRPTSSVGRSRETPNLTPSSGSSLSHITSPASASPSAYVSDSTLASEASAVSTSDSASAILALDLARKQFQSAVQRFTLAQSKAEEAEASFAKARSVTNDETGEAIARAQATAQAIAIATISRAREAGRSGVLEARHEYVKSMVKAHAKVTIMKMIERRFRSLAADFAKARRYARASIIAIRNTQQALEEATGRSRTSFYGAKEAYATAVATAKSRVSKMKVIEKRFLAVTEAYAKARAEAKIIVRDVRKRAFAMASASAAAAAGMSASIKMARVAVYQALAAAKASSMGKATAIENAVAQARSVARSSIRSSAIALAEARSQVEALTVTPAYGTSSPTTDNSAYGDDARRESYISYKDG